MVSLKAAVVPTFFKRVKTTLILAGGFCLATLILQEVSAQEVRLVKDINPGNLSSFADEIVPLGGTMFFRAFHDTYDYELWRSDGTNHGTELVRDINPLGSAFPQHLTVVNDLLFFAADDGTHGRELWKSDGTIAGTILVKDINVGSGDSIGPSLGSLAALGGMLIFAADNGIHGRELWKSDGTVGGTTLVKDIKPGSGDSLFVNMPADFTQMNDTLYFVATDGIHGRELWKTEGSSGGTTLFKDTNPSSSETGIAPQELTNLDNMLMFFAGDNTTGSELWKSNGTVVGTTLVKDIWPGVSGQFPFAFVPAALDGILFFFARDGSHGEELWRSDGTESGTWLVKDIRPGGTGSSDSSAQILQNVRGTVYLFADDGSHGSELWKTDGSSSGTVLVKDINPGLEGSLTIYDDSTAMEDLNGFLLFSADDGAHGAELWTSDGSSAGTVLVKDIYPGEKDSLSPFNDFPFFAKTDNRLFFPARDDVYGEELWVVDVPTEVRNWEDYR